MRAPIERSPKFLVDENLAGMTRWLRFFGFDAIRARGWKDREVAQNARKSGRIIVTRDREFYSWIPQPAILLETDVLEEQLRTVLNIVGAPAATAWFSLCVECNTKLRELSPDEIQGVVDIPDFVKRSSEQKCWECVTCHKLYWQGSHYDRTLRFLEGLASPQGPQANDRLRAPDKNIS